MSSQRGKRAVVEAGEASESDEGEGELFQESQTPTKRTSMKSTDSPLSKMGTSADAVSVSSLTEASGSITSVSQELPARPVHCRPLVEGNHVLSKGIREAAALPYAVAIKEIDDVALDLVKGQQLMDDVYRVLETVGSSLQSIEREADELRAYCAATLPAAPSGQNRPEKPPTSL